MESPKEGGFHPGADPQLGGGSGGEIQSKAMLMKHIKELYEQISQAEEDKQKIADEAYRSVCQSSWVFSFSFKHFF